MLSRGKIGWCLACLTLAVLVQAVPAGAAARWRPRCGTADFARLEARAARVEPPGTLLRVLQDPATVTPGFKGKIRYELAVLGDFESVDLEVVSFAGVEALAAERRDSYTNPRGEVISFFEVEGTLEEWLVLPWSWDIDLTSPLVFSELLYLGPETSRQPIFLPIALLPAKVPRSKVTRRGNRIQYASNVVNVAVPDLHQRQLDEQPSLGFDPLEIIDFVRSELGDFDYDEFGFGLWQYEMTNPGAFHVGPREGTTYPAYSVYTGAAFVSRELWSHEVNHNWNFRYDLPRLVGWKAPFDGFHSRGTVARDAGFLCCGGYPKSKTQGRWRTEWIRDPHPFHPLELFAMGLIDAGEVPDMWVFKRQGLDDFRANEILPGPTRKLTIDQVIAEYGEPDAAATDVWRVLPVVVSQRLLPKKTLSALNFFLRRIEDPEGKTPGSFDQATRHLMDLQTTVHVSGPRPPKKVTFPAIGKREIPGLVLTRALPGCVRPGEPVRLVGRTTTGQPPGLALAPSNPDYPVLEAPEQTSSGFDVQLSPQKEDVYQVLLEGIWPRDEPLPVKVGPIYVTAECPGG